MDERSLWNKKYSEGSHTSLEPDPLLVNAYAEFLQDSGPGKALDVAGGAARHALWLAERGWQVKLVDVSEVGIEVAQQNARQRNVTIETQVLDLNDAPDLGREQYDLAIVFFYLQRELFPALISALKSGGFLIYKTYSTEQRKFSGGPTHPLHLLEPNELLRAFSWLRVLHYHETVSGKGVAELIAQKRHALS
ncbi:MAG: hypothetical protein DMG65_18255 [Candidatus Angelobacter sp. Gp1-AA117]|nr:MAG: hypothetical protein DMG65_18255 [Candidatus Angelobacter sp. Gp1-AA117]